MYPSARGCAALILAGTLLGCGGATATAPRDTAPIQAAVPRAHTLTWGGLAREYSVLRPVSAPRMAPLLLVLHLLDDSATQAGAGTALVRAAEHDGFVVAEPVGVGFSWNAGICCGDAVAKGVDDVGLLTAMIHEIVVRDHVDPKRVYVAGFSNGGMLAYRLACEGTSPLAGVAVIEGTLGIERCAPTRPVDVLVIHQTGDAVVPYAGTSRAEIPGNPVPLMSVERALAIWRDAAGCRQGPAVTRSRRVTVTTYSCSAGRRARLVTIEGGDHRWPKRPVDPADATDLITSFFGLSKARG